jgi:hypothetical protein
VNANLCESGPGSSRANKSKVEMLKMLMLTIKLGPLQALVIGLLAVLLLIAIFIPDTASQAVADKSLFQDTIFALLVTFVLELIIAGDSYQKTTDILDRKSTRLNSSHCD